MRAHYKRIPVNFLLGFFALLQSLTKSEMHPDWHRDLKAFQTDLIWIQLAANGDPELSKFNAKMQLHATGVFSAEKFFEMLITSPHEKDRFWNLHKLLNQLILLWKLLFHSSSTLAGSGRGIEIVNYSQVQDWSTNFKTFRFDFTTTIRIWVQICPIQTSWQS